MNSTDASMCSQGQTSRPARLLIGCLIASVIAFIVVLCRLQLDADVTMASGEANIQRLVPYWCTFALTWLALTALWFRLRRTMVTGGTLQAAALIIVVAAGARVVVLFLHQPTFSDDIYRYVFDGRNLASGINPFVVKPDDAIAEPPVPAADGLARHINNPELFTIYLPTSQYVFAGAAVLTNAAQSPEQMATEFRAVFIVIELVAIVLMLFALHHARQSPWWAALYAWHPLAITEIAGSGHQDAIGLVFLAATLLVVQMRPARIALWTALLACASLVKPIVIPIAASALRTQSLGKWLLSLATGAVVVLALAVPLLAADDWQALENLRATAQRFSFKWVHFGSVYEPLLWIIERMTPSWGNDPQELAARGVCTGLLAMVILVIVLRCRDIWRAAAYMLLAMVLLTPAAHPWYLLWALILLPRARLHSVWCLSLTLAWGYAAFGYAEIDGALKWSAPAWLMVPAYLPVYGALLYDVMSRRNAA